MKWIKISFVMFFFALLITVSSYANSENRLALVIGNADYKYKPLKNPTNDASDLKTMLLKLGFKVIYKENLNQMEMINALREFESRLKNDGGVGLFYFAGHGMQVQGKNFLIPIDSGITTEDEVPFFTLALDLVLAKLATADNKMNIVILDACRDNPLASSIRSGSRGLARLEDPVLTTNGLLMFYATASNNVAQDGEGRNGIFTKHLLKALKNPGITIEKVFKDTANAVLEDTGGKQYPWMEGSIRYEFIINREKSSIVKKTDSGVEPSEVKLLTPNDERLPPPKEDLLGAVPLDIWDVCNINVPRSVEYIRSKLGVPIREAYPSSSRISNMVYEYSNAYISVLIDTKNNSIAGYEMLLKEGWKQNPPVILNGDWADDVLDCVNNDQKQGHIKQGEYCLKWASLIPLGEIKLSDIPGIDECSFSGSHGNRGGQSTVGCKIRFHFPSNAEGFGPTVVFGYKWSADSDWARVDDALGGNGELRPIEEVSSWPRRINFFATFSFSYYELLNDEYFEFWR